MPATSTNNHQRYYFVSYITAWGVLHCIIIAINLFCSITPFDVVITWGNTLQFVTMTSYFFYFEFCFLNYIPSLAALTLTGLIPLSHNLFVFTRVLLVFTRGLLYSLVFILCSLALQLCVLVLYFCLLVQGRSQEFYGRWLKVFKNVSHHGWPTKKILGCGTAKTVTFGPFPMRFHVL